jgi:hypothetical protein
MISNLNSNGVPVGGEVQSPFVSRLVVTSAPGDVPAAKVFFLPAKPTKDDEVALRAVLDAYERLEKLKTLQNYVHNFPIKRSLTRPTAKSSADSNRTPSTKASFNRPAAIQLNNKPAVSITQDKPVVQKAKEPVTKKVDQNQNVRPKVELVPKNVIPVRQGEKKAPLVPRLKEPFKKVTFKKENIKPAVNQAPAKTIKVREVCAPQAGAAQRQSERAQAAQDIFIQRQAAARAARMVCRS